jgi:ribonuclease-3
MAKIKRLLNCITRYGGRSSGLTKERRTQLMELCRVLGVSFRDLNLLNQALMHRSYVHDVDMDRGESNERMEFLGDAVLGLLVNEHLYARFTERQEGRLTKIKSLVVSETVLAKRAEELSLGEYVCLSDNERSSGGAGRASILADAFEAVIGALYLDSGLPSARRFIESHLLNGMDKILAVDEYKNYKSIMQEHAQRKLGSRPRYRVVSAKGPEHERTFYVEVRLGGRSLGRGEGKNKKEAEQMAARHALVKLGVIKGKKGARTGRSGSSRGRRRPRRRKKEQSQ